ncbi:MAG: hypothetical protein ACO2Z8_02795 [Burkholderiaceae bacterium]
MDFIGDLATLAALGGAVWAAKDSAAAMLRPRVAQHARGRDAVLSEMVVGLFEML